MPPVKSQLSLLDIFRKLKSGYDNVERKFFIRKIFDGHGCLDEYAFYIPRDRDSDFYHNVGKKIGEMESAAIDRDSLIELRHDINGKCIPIEVLMGMDFLKKPDEFGDVLLEREPLDIFEEKDRDDVLIVYLRFGYMKMEDLCDAKSKN